MQKVTTVTTFFCVMFLSKSRMLLVKLLPNLGMVFEFESESNGDKVYRASVLPMGYSVVI